jgi:K+-transporting ATPase KdpF subunit
MNATILLLAENVTGVASSYGYLIGGIISFLILGYLVYSLIKPEKF